MRAETPHAFPRMPCEATRCSPTESARRRPSGPGSAYTAELTQDGYAYRFRHDDRPLQAAEGAFLLCGFVLALALHQQGQEVDAARWFERNRAACGTPGLYAEEYDVSERQLRGNLPQAFVHALMLECAARLNSPWKPEWRTGQDDGQCPDEED